MKWWWKRWKENREKVKLATTVPMSNRGYDALHKKYPFFSYNSYGYGRHFGVNQPNLCNMYPSEENTLYEIQEVISDGTSSCEIRIYDQTSEPDQQTIMRKGAYYSHREKRVVSDRKKVYGRVKVLDLQIGERPNMTLPSCLIKLTDLQRLIISCELGWWLSLNPIFFPPDMANMSKLSQLDFAFTGLRDAAVSTSLRPQERHSTSVFPNIKVVRICPLLMVPQEISEKGEKYMVDFIFKQCPNIENVELQFLDLETKFVDRLLKNMQDLSIKTAITPSPHPLSSLKTLSLIYCDLTENHLALLLCDIVPNQNSIYRLEKLDVSHNNIQTLVKIAQTEPFKSMFSLMPKIQSAVSTMGVKRSFSLRCLKVTSNPISRRLRSDDRKYDDEHDAAHIIIRKLGIEQFWFVDDNKPPRTDQFNEASRICYKLKDVQEKEWNRATDGSKSISTTTTTTRLGTGGWEYILEKYSPVITCPSDDEKFSFQATILYSILRSHFGDILPNMNQSKRHEKMSSSKKDCRRRR